MIDVTTKEPLSVLVEGDAPPYMWIPVRQLEDVCTLLNANNVPYWVDEESISIDGGPEVIVINIERNYEAADVQKILDNAP